MSGGDRARFLAQQANEEKAKSAVAKKLKAERTQAHKKRGKQKKRGKRNRESAP